jgi:hypothetical protein
MTKGINGIHNNLVSGGKGSQLFTNGKTFQMTYYFLASHGRMTSLLRVGKYDFV